jgi:transposase
MDMPRNELSSAVTMEGVTMLYDAVPPRLSAFDQQVFRVLVPQEHYLSTLLQVVPWDDFHELLAPYYCRDHGRPAESPVLMLKLEYLRYHHNLSDREVIARASTDVAFRYFLQFPLAWKLPAPSSLCIFRGRLGVTGFRKVFDKVVHAARENGVVKDCLRIKDATHVIADIAVPSALALVAQTRDKLLTATEPFAPLLVEGERVNLDILRQTTKTLKPEERLVTRVTQLREMLVWAAELSPPENAENNHAWQKFLAQRELAQKIVEDQQRPGGERTVSTTDPDARCGKHGGWFDGYLVDVMMDADSELITAINVLPANGDEAADAVELIRQEETAHGNDVEALSIDGVGFNGPMLRELKDEWGVDTYVPVPKQSDGECFTPSDFQEDCERGVVTCPGGQTSRHGYPDKAKQTTKYRFDAKVCAGCAFQIQCMKNPPRRCGRTVCKSDYQVEHERARQKTTTEEYAAVRRKHKKVERKLGEMVNRHGGRRARYRGIDKVLMQELMSGLATNIKRLQRIVCAPIVAYCPQT